MTLRAPILLALLCLSACAGVQLPKDKLGDSPGALLFNGYTHDNVTCFKCHNGDGRGAMLRGPSLADATSDKSDPQLVDVIKDGDGRMPAYKDRLSEAEIGQIVAWLHASFPAPAKP